MVAASRIGLALGGLFLLGQPAVGVTTGAIPWSANLSARAGLSAERLTVKPASPADNFKYDQLLLL
jgi:hypothetical protein